jgi:hypothetical protein
VLKAAQEAQGYVTAGFGERVDLTARGNGGTGAGFHDGLGTGFGIQGKVVGTDLGTGLAGDVGVGFCGFGTDLGTCCGGRLATSFGFGGGLCTKLSRSGTGRGAGFDAGFVTGLGDGNSKACGCGGGPGV